MSSRGFAVLQFKEQTDILHCSVSPNKETVDVLHVFTLFTWTTVVFTDKQMFSFEPTWWLYWRKRCHFERDTTSKMIKRMKIRFGNIHVFPLRVILWLLKLFSHVVWKRQQVSTDLFFQLNLPFGEFCSTDLATFLLCAGQNRAQGSSCRIWRWSRGGGGSSRWLSYRSPVCWWRRCFFFF